MAGKISISITDEHAALLQEAVGSGAYARASTTALKRSRPISTPGSSV